MRRLLVALLLTSCLAPSTAQARKHHRAEIHAVKSDRQLEALTGGVLAPNTEVGSVVY